MVDPKDDLVAHLRAELDTSGISVTFQPGPSGDTQAEGDVQHADYQGAREYPVVVVATKDSTPVDGGQTGVTAIDTATGGPVQSVIYTIQVDCWGGPRTASIYSSEGSDPDTVAGELGEAVAAACRVGEDGVPDGYGWMMAEPPSEADDTQESPVVHREIVVVRMGRDYGP